MKDMEGEVQGMDGRIEGKRRGEGMREDGGQGSKREEGEKENGRGARIGRGR